MKHHWADPEWRRRQCKAISKAVRASPKVAAARAARRLRQIGKRKGPLSLEARAAISRALSGRSLSPAHRASLSHASKTSFKAIAARARKNMSPTRLEYALQMLLESAGLEFKAQQSFGRYIVDAYVPSHNLVFEADGEPFHTWNEQHKPGYHARRDKALLETGIAAVIHLTGKDLDSWVPPR